MKNTFRYGAMLLFGLLICVSVQAGHQGDSKVKRTDLKIGEGPEATLHSRISVHYTGWLEDGSAFDSSRNRDEPFQFQLGTGQVIPGWDLGIEGMRSGGKRELVIPPELAYGANGAGGKIPPNATLRFEVELLDATPPKYRNLDNDQLSQALADGALLIDIRRDDEWSSTGIIEGSKLLTAFDKNGRFIGSFPDELAKLAKADTPLILLCRTGNRSSMLANFLAEQGGYQQVSNVERGIVEWIKQKHPITKTP